MAKIKIKGRMETIDISRERAEKVKVMKFGNGKPGTKMDGATLIDLDVWSGELSQIAWVDMAGESKLSDKAKDDFIKKRIKEREAEEKEWQSKSPLEKSKSCSGWANFYYARITGNCSNTLSAEQMAEVEKALLILFTKVPRHSFPPPSSIIRNLFKIEENPSAEVEEKNNAENKTDLSTATAEKCEGCGVELAKGKTRVCSGACYDKLMKKKKTVKKLTKKTK
jgi:hypothetical protein